MRVNALRFSAQTEVYIPVLELAMDLALMLMARTRTQLDFVLIMATNFYL